MTRIISIIAILAMAAIGGWAQVDLTEHVVSIPGESVTTYGPVRAGVGKYYKIDLQLPKTESADTLMTARLELYLDVESFVRGDFRWLDADSVEHVGYKAPTPLVEVYALKSLIGGALQKGQLDTDTAARRPVLVGQYRRVVLDITPIVQSFIADPTRNRGIVIGSFVGQQEGDFTLREGDFQDGSRAKVSLEFARAR